MDPGTGVDLLIRVKKRVDLVLGLYVSDLVAGNDADPVWGPLLGVRWRRPIGDPRGKLVPFAAAGAGLLWIQAELGLEIAPRSSIGLEMGLRDRFSAFNSVQGFLLVRIKRLPAE